MSDLFLPHLGLRICSFFFWPEVACAFSTFFRQLCTHPVWLVCIDLIEKQPRGILGLLDEECKVPKGTDETYLLKVSTTHGRNPCFGMSSLTSFEPPTFFWFHTPLEVMTKM